MFLPGKETPCILLCAQCYNTVCWNYSSPKDQPFTVLFPTEVNDLALSLQQIKLSLGLPIPHPLQCAHICVFLHPVCIYWEPIECMPMVRDRDSFQVFMFERKILPVERKFS